MSHQPKDVRIDVKVRNNLVLLAMEKRGIPTVAELCRQIGKPSRQAYIGELVNMKMSARNRDGTWLPTVLMLADFFLCEPKDLFSDPQQYQKLKKNRAHAEIAYAEIEQLTARRQEPVTPELAIQAKELRQAITTALQTLTPREERVIRMRFGFDIGEEQSAVEIGEQLGVSHSRVHQIEAKALRKLKHPHRAKILADAGGAKKNEDDRWGNTTYSMDFEALKAL